MLNNTHAQVNNKEFLELGVIFVGELPTEEINFRYGVIHYAGCMSKVPYSLKIFLIRKAFKLTPAVEAVLSKITIFIVKISVLLQF